MLVQPGVSVAEKPWNDDGGASAVWSCCACVTCAVTPLGPLNSTSVAVAAPTVAGTRSRPTTTPTTTQAPLGNLFTGDGQLADAVASRSSVLIVGPPQMPTC